MLNLGMELNDPALINLHMVDDGSVQELQAQETPHVTDKQDPVLIELIFRRNRL